MKKYPFLMYFTLMMVGLCAQEQPIAEIGYYSGGSDLISLGAIPGAVVNYLDIQGTSKLKSLMMEITSPKGKKNQAIPLNTNGSFSVRYFIRTGPGTYKINLFGSKSATSLQYQGLAYFTLKVFEGTYPTDDGVLNGKVLDFVNKVMGQTVGRGECWDVVQEVLDQEGADWVRPLTYGRLLDPQKEPVLPGDLIQFLSLRIDEKLPNGGSRWEILGSPDHTSVIYEVLGPLHYKLAHQNLSGKRFVQVTELDLNKKTSGKYWIYRPVSALSRL